ncbi:MAG: TMEM165/GDT1 family protein [Acidobacteriaceae bacterium]
MLYPQPIGALVEALLISLVAVAVAEIGDKTQLLSLILAARYRKPWPICAGIFLATLANHFLAGEAGILLTHCLSPEVMRWLIGLSFLSVAVWALFPDKADERDASCVTRYGVFIATVVGFFLAEMGDRTQIATAMLATRYQPLWQVVAGTTLGMLAANVPVVFCGARFAQRLPLRTTRLVAAVLFATLGIFILLRG